MLNFVHKLCNNALFVYFARKVCKIKALKFWAMQVLLDACVLRFRKLTNKAFLIKFLEKNNERKKKCFNWNCVDLCQQ